MLNQKKVRVERVFVMVRVRLAAPSAGRFVGWIFGTRELDLCVRRPTRAITQSFSLNFVNFLFVVNFFSCVVTPPKKFLKSFNAFQMWEIGRSN